MTLIIVTLINEVAKKRVAKIFFTFQGLLLSHIPVTIFICKGSRLFIFCFFLWNENQKLTVCLFLVGTRNHSPFSC